MRSQRTVQHQWPPMDLKLDPVVGANAAANILAFGLTVAGCGERPAHKVWGGNCR
ncbi:hypothetical protein C8E05_0897 [Rhodococcus wratislaviensis]|uniref:Uncharacterized protein n=1 Tax=Rhodococcus wratislaviensis TaxID=44752 RepID=A0AB38FFY5_RHOWR|nr:hypothetical protein C8E05_0897 [Rhodococcus wratislaviensis]SPZ40464.1 Uncharacterised protein [Rhodococcus wratislaviensis]